MTKDGLSTNRINYLIWRYLQECNYKETALKLQKEWNIEDPQTLEFAPHVKQQALVAVLHQGLLYSEIERSASQARLQSNAASLPGPFGPLNAAPPAPVADANDGEAGRKREVEVQSPEVQQNGSPAKRPRLSNGLENGFETTPMDLDEVPNGNGHAYPSPKEVEPTPPPIFTEGPEKSAQVEKIAELGADTLYLTLSDPETPDNRPLALFSAWNPQDPTVLAGAGTDGLARLWTLSRGAGEQNGHVTPFRNLVDSSNTKGSNAKSTTTALAWTSDGSALALASEWDDENATPIPGTARISIFNSDGSLAGEHSGFDSPILCLQWNPSNSALLALVPDNNFLMVHIFHGSTQITFPTDQRLDQNLHAVWTGESEFILYGGRILSLFSVSDGKIMRSGKFEVPDGRRLLRASYDRHTQLLATASEDGIIDVWNHSGECRSIQAHRGQITALEWQPLSAGQGLDNTSERLLASAGDDCSISIWSLASESKPKYSMTMDHGVVALSFTPDGAFLASATSRQILIWRMEDVSTPRARWNLDSERDLGDDTMNAPDDEQERNLSWDASGHKLAYGINNSIAVIEWRPMANGVVH